MSEIVSGPILVTSRLPDKKTDTPNSTSFLDKRHFGKPLRRHVEEFGAIFGILFCGFGSWHAFHGKPWSLLLTLAAFGVAFPLLGYKAPAVLYPLWKYWMKFAQVLGTIMTTLILSICWFLVLAPSALLLKIIGKKVMDTRFGAPVESYWEDRKTGIDQFQRLNKQF